MTRILMLVGAVAATALVTAGVSTAAETKVELKNVHMCCDGCAKEVTKILGEPVHRSIALTCRASSYRSTSSQV